MSKATDSETKRSQSDSLEFFIPATPAAPSFDRLDAAVTDLFDFHGVVPIPDSYGK